MSQEAAGRIRVRVTYSGRVQGVGFRAAAVELSRRTVIVGFVRNLANGTVELEAEGQPRHVEDFLAAVGTRMGGYIGTANRTLIEPLGQEHTFEIRD